ncbi:hypothetical protein GTY88_23775 [Streptomyces sp. SID5926]|nr:hypothetical protein [Streptomyces sp. SID5926]
MSPKEVEERLALSAEAAREMRRTTLSIGGTKSCGIGRELAAEGIRKFCNLKTVQRG